MPNTPSSSEGCGYNCSQLVDLWVASLALAGAIGSLFCQCRTESLAAPRMNFIGSHASAFLRMKLSDILLGGLRASAARQDCSSRQRKQEQRAGHSILARACRSHWRLLPLLPLLRPPLPLRDRSRRSNLVVLRTIVTVKLV